ncbi:hypothetical protein NECAME_17193 [Necator americanus]|uniref:Uncharacterized protein n=1 Tax=Necator americanus TaxID=51031 RepID=W2TR44_NECAM|nr:hypothetical protein NECAME_17193 [Necator americanus]ETN84248.1 hypothetical protein NECAME_17193 [Necator americanus]
MTANFYQKKKWRRAPKEIGSRSPDNIMGTSFRSKSLSVTKSGLMWEFQDFVLREAFVVNFAVHPIPDFQNVTIREKFEEMIGHLEQIPKYAAGPESTIIWTRDYNTISAFFASKVSTHFDMENLYLQGSPLTEISRRMQDFVLREAFVVNFAVHPIPDFQNVTIREKFEEMIGHLEQIPKYAAGPESTIIWTRDYNTAIAFWGEEEDFWTPETMLKTYREYGFEEKFITTKHLKNGTEVMDGFYFIIAYHNMSTFPEVQDLMEQRRAIIASYPFNVLSHHPLEKVPTESAASVPKNFLQTAVRDRYGGIRKQFKQRINQ